MECSNSLMWGRLLLKVVLAILEVVVHCSIQKWDEGPPPGVPRFDEGTFRRLRVNNFSY